MGKLKLSFENEKWYINNALQFTFLLIFQFFSEKRPFSCQSFNKNISLSTIISLRWRSERIKKVKRNKWQTSFVKKKEVINTTIKSINENNKTKWSIFNGRSSYWLNSEINSNYDSWCWLKHLRANLWGITRSNKWLIYSR